MMLITLFKSIFSKNTPGLLSKDEVSLLSDLRSQEFPSPLKGRELAIAQKLESKGYLKTTGAKLFIITEKGLLALRSPRV